MKKNFKFYAAIWVLLLVAFLAIIFLIRNAIFGDAFSNDPSFWIAFVFVIVSFIINLGCAYFVFKKDNLQKVFYNIPLISISWTALIAMMIIGTVLMLIPNVPSWIAGVICIIIVAINTIAVVKASWAAETLSNIDEKIKSKTAFIKLLTIDAESTMNRAKSEAVKSECKKVYEAVRYSDPMSNEALSVAEAKITVKFDEFSAAADSDDIEKTKELAEELINLIRDRNNKCRSLK